MTKSVTPADTRRDNIPTKEIVRDTTEFAQNQEVWGNEMEQRMFVDPIEDGEICPSCGEVPLTGEPGEDVECPNCGDVFYIPAEEGK